MPSDHNFFATAVSIVAPQVKLYACCGCHGDFRLNALNDDMMCEACGEGGEDEDYAPSEGYLRKWEGTFSV